MQDVIAYVLIVAAVVIGGYVILEILMFMLQVLFANQSALISAPLP